MHSTPFSPQLAEKLSVMQVDQDLVTWITDYLTERPQYVRLQGCLSDNVVSNTGLYTSEHVFK